MIAVDRTPNLQRVGFLALLPGILKKHETDPAEVLRSAGLSTQALDNPDSTIPFEAMGRLVEIAADKTQCPHIGLEIGSMILTRTLGPIGELMRNAPTLGDALLDFAMHQHRNAHGGVVYLTADTSHAFFGYAVYQVNVPGNQIICDAAATAAWNLVRELASDENAIEGVSISRTEPIELEPYRCIFKSKYRFDAEQTGVSVPVSILQKPIRGADPALRKLLAGRVARTWHAGELDLLTQIRRALRLGLIHGHASAIEISDELGMGRRTLQRHLDQAGISFQELLDEARCEFAQQLLVGTRLHIADVSKIVGYPDPSVFTRAFVRWRGTTPTTWRASSAPEVSV